MEHWDNRVCHALSELGFGVAMMMSGLALGASMIIALGLGVI